LCGYAAQKNTTLHFIEKLLVFRILFINFTPSSHERKAHMTGGVIKILTAQPQRLSANRGLRPLKEDFFASFENALRFQNSLLPLSLSSS
jgi:hypothetical protein